MSQTQTRVPGGGNTYIRMGLTSTIKLEFLANYNDSPGKAVAQPEEIQPIGSPYPKEIATAYAQAAGTLTLKVWNTWGKDGWVSALMSSSDDGSLTDTTGIWDAFVSSSSTSKGNQLDGYPVDVKEVLEAQRMNSDSITVQKIEKNAAGDDFRIKNYVGAVITDIDATENVNNSSMPRDTQVTITIKYTNVQVVSASA